MTSVPKVHNLHGGFDLAIKSTHDQCKTSLFAGLRTCAIRDLDLSSCVVWGMRVQTEVAHFDKSEELHASVLN